MIFAAKIKLIKLILLLVVVSLFLPVEICESSTTHPKHFNDIGNPMKDSEKCGRKGIKSHVCDPDGLITVEQAFQLDGIINEIYKFTVCPCLSMSACHSSGDKGGGGYIVGVAMVGKMVLDPSTQYRSDTDPEYNAAILKRARLFATKILYNWKMGRCQEDLLIFYSMLDNVIYIATNAISKSWLPDSVVGGILRDASFKIESRTKESITEGLKFILRSIRDPLKNSAPPPHVTKSMQYSDDDDEDDDDEDN